ncbi:MAG TPA: hypothetical protein G4O18_01945 [Dehalococcoidia bacterium]|nr:hypothetical protein [Dehalococcoidia bacterium]
MRRRIILVGLTISLLLMPVMAGCDMMDLDFTMDVDYHTTVEASGDIVQEIRCEITGGLVTMFEEAGLLEEADFANELEQGGWDVDIESTDDSLIIDAVGSYVLDEDGNISQIEGGPEIPEGFSVRVESGLLSKKYYAEFNATGDGGEMFATGGEMGELAELMMENMFSISWTITLPGSVVESNASVVEGGTATWDFDFGAISSGIDITVQSQYTNWPVIGGIIAGVVVVLALVALFFIIRKRRAPTSLPGEISGEGVTFSSQ